MNHNFKGVWITDDEFCNLAPRNVFHRQYDKSFEKLDCSKHRNRHILFRKKFSLSETGRAIMYITADDYYKLYINGVFVSQGPAPCYHTQYNYNVLDVTDYLKEGENLIAVHTLYQGLINRVWQSGDNRHGLIFDLEIDGECVLCTDETFLTKPHDGFTETHTVGYDTQFMEKQDSNASCFGFEDVGFDDSDWKTAKKNNFADHKLSEQKTSCVAFEKILPVVSQMRGNTLYLDFGKVYAGCLRVKAKGKKGDEIIVKCAQELNGDGTVRYELRANCRYIEPWILSGGCDSLEWFDFKAFRYVELDIPEGAELSDIYFEVRHYPFTLARGIKPEYRGNADIEAIWNLCIDTMKYAVQEVIQDCCEREKGFYVGDGCYTALTHFIVSGDDSIVRKLIDDGFYSSFITDGLVTCLDCSFMQEIAEYSIMLIHLVLWHYRMTGDIEYLRENYPKCVKLLEVYRRDYEKDNILIVSDKWNLVEWPENYRDNYDLSKAEEGQVCSYSHVVMTAHYLESIKSTNKIAEILGEESYRDTSELYAKFLELFYDGEKKLFRDSVGSDHFSIVGNFYCFGFELYPDGECKEKIAGIISERKISSIGLFTCFPTLWGLIRAGYNDILLNDCILDDGAWKRILREDGTMTFEGWGKDTKWNTSLMHLTMSCVATFLADIDIGKVLE